MTLAYFIDLPVHLTAPSATTVSRDLIITVLGLVNALDFAITVSFTCLYQHQPSYAYMYLGSLGSTFCEVKAVSGGLFHKTYYQIF